MTRARIMNVRKVATALAVLALVPVHFVACGDDTGFVQEGCDASNCNGCCSSSGLCESGTTREDCGFAGASCVECPDYQSCASTGACSPCDAGSCLGCCDEDGVCQAGDDGQACGDGGEQCSVCGGPQFPNAFTCYELDLTTHYCTSV